MIITLQSSVVDYFSDVAILGEKIPSKNTQLLKVVLKSFMVIPGILEMIQSWHSALKSTICHEINQSFESKYFNFFMNNDNGKNDAIVVGLNNNVRGINPIEPAMNQMNPNVAPEVQN